MSVLLGLVWYTHVVICMSVFHSSDVTAIRSHFIFVMSHLSDNGVGLSFCYILNYVYVCVYLLS